MNLSVSLECFYIHSYEYALNIIFNLV
jgi:hypothetical protein